MLPADRGPSGTGHDTAASGFDALGETRSVPVTEAAPAPHPRRLEDAALSLAHRAEYVAEHIMDSGLAPRLQMLRDAILDVRREVDRARNARRSDPPVAVPGPASESTHGPFAGPYSSCPAWPGPASVSPAEPREAESDWMLLVALGMLLSWRIVRYEENMGGGWFSASELGTHPIRADEVRQLYAKESEARRAR